MAAKTLAQVDTQLWVLHNQGFQIAARQGPQLGVGNRHSRCGPRPAQEKVAFTQDTASPKVRQHRNTRRRHAYPARLDQVHRRTGVTLLEDGLIARELLRTQALAKRLFFGVSQISEQGGILDQTRFHKPTSS